MTFGVKVTEVARTISVASTRVPIILMRIFVLFSITWEWENDAEDGNEEKRTPLEVLPGLGKCRTVDSTTDQTSGQGGGAERAHQRKRAAQGSSAGMWVRGVGSCPRNEW